MPPNPEWSGPRPFVGREIQLERLEAALERAIAGEGLYAFVLGAAGAGKERLVSRLLEDATRRDVGIVEVHTGKGKGVWSAVRARLTRRRRIIRFLTAVLPEWIDLVPVVGPVTSAVIRTIQSLRGGGRSREDPRIARRRAGAVAAVDEALAETRSVLIIVLRDFEAASDADLAGAFHSLRAVARHPVLVVAEVSSVRGRAPGRIDDLIREAERYGVTEIVDLPPLDRGEWRAALEQATGGPVPEPWLQWFEQHEPIQPGGLWRLMGEAESTGGLQRRGALWAWGPSPSAPSTGFIEDLDPEVVLAPLAPADRHLLAAATANGPSFESDWLRERTGSDELALHDQLARLERAGWIRSVETGSGGALEDRYTLAVPGLMEALRRWAADQPAASG